MKNLAGSQNPKSSKETHVPHGLNTNEESCQWPFTKMEAPGPHPHHTQTPGEGPCV